MSELVVYGVPFSQPVRAVLWALLHKNHPFRLELINPGYSGAGGSRHTDYVQREGLCRHFWDGWRRQRGDTSRADRR